MNMKIEDGLRYLRTKLLNNGEVLETERWQGEKATMPFLEVLHAGVKVQMYNGLDLENADFYDREWCELHFEERVSGKPLNPPPSHAYWNKGTEDYMSDGKFSHSYPERMWPRTLIDKGVRFKTADLGTLVDVLSDDKTTRQAYLPIFFPEDLTASLEGERIPCTLGWHFIIRNDRLDVFYPMRSCDAIRHLQNDFYFANRLALWVIDKLPYKVNIGILHFEATSLHCFENDRYALQKRIK